MSASPPDIRLLALDVDGVLTDGLIRYDDRGGEAKAFHVRDGHALRLWADLGRASAIVTGRSSPVVDRRAAELGVGTVRQGVRDKGACLREIAGALGIDLVQVAAVGDDLPDLPMLRTAGYPVAVADAVPEVRAAAAFVTTLPGGRGAVREVVEHLLRRDGRWGEIVARFDRPPTARP